MNHTEFPTSSWRKSSYSGDAGNCVEVATAPTAVGVRDTKNRDGGVLSVSQSAWAHFLSACASA